MSLKIANKKGTFHLPADFTLEIEDTSPIYSNEGSQSTTATFPPTPGNFRLISHAHRLDASRKPLADDDQCLITDGYTTRIGSMNITEVSTQDGITANIGFDESEVYRLWDAVKLRSLELPVYAPEGGLPELVTYLEDILNERRTDTPLHVFNICVSNPVIEKDSKKTAYPEELNIYTRNQGLHLVSYSHKETFCLDNEPVEVTLPEGYGLTAFLKVSYILDTLFTAYGYTLIENPIATHPQLSRLVVLNNSADCCVKGVLNYADLMPDCTINEFFQALYCRFGLVYFIDGNSRTVRLKFIRDIINSAPRHTINNLRQSPLSVSYQEAQQLRLSAATNINDPEGLYNASPAAETFDDFLKPYNYVLSYYGGYLIYSLSRGVFILNGPYYKDRVKVASSDFFAWDRGSDCAYLDISSVDESLPVKSCYEGNLGSYYRPMYLFGKIHRYTCINSSTVELSENLDASTPLCFCFAMPEQDVVPYGSPRCLFGNNNPVTDKQGNKFDISLTFVGEYGLFNRFWRDYDAILRHANHLVEDDFTLTHREHADIDIASPVSIEGQPLLIESKQYTLPAMPRSKITLRMRTLRLLEPYDLDQEQNVPIVKQLYKWVFFDNKTTVVNAATKALVSEWMENIRKLPGHIWDKTFMKNESDNTPDKVPYTVPTQEEYESGKQIYIQRVSYSFDLYYRYKVWETNPLGGQSLATYEGGGTHFDVQYDLYLRADLL